MVNELRTSVQIQNNKSTNAVIQDLVEPSKKATNENNVSDYNNLDNDNEYNNFVLLSGAKNRQEIVNKTRELTQDSLAKHDKYERHSDRKYVSKEKQAAIILERFNSLKNKKQVKTFDEYKKLLATSSIEQNIINNKIADERLRVYEERSAKRRGSGATQELLTQIGTGGKYDPLTDEEKIKVAKATDKFLYNEFSDNLKPISTVVHNKESITHMQELFTSIDDRGHLNAKQAVYDAMTKYNARHKLPALQPRDYAGAFKEFVNTVDDFQRQKCIEYGYNNKYDFEFAKRSASKTKGKKSLRQIKVEQLDKRAKEQDKRDKELDKKQQEQDKEQDRRSHKLAKIVDELAKRDKEVTQREHRVSDAEDRNIITNYELRDRERQVKQKETKLDKRDKEQDKRDKELNKKIVNFRDELLQAAYQQHDKNDLHAMAIKNEVTLKNGRKEPVIQHVLNRLYALSATRVKSVIQVIQDAKQPDYFSDDNNVKKQKSKQKSNDDELEL